VTLLSILKSPWFFLPVTAVISFMVGYSIGQTVGLYKPWRKP
jgi:C4-dicarboxylate transporter